MDGDVISLPTSGLAEEPGRGDRTATLFDRHHQRLFRLARRLTQSRDDAADLVQETFLRVARDPARVPEGPASEEAWLVRVLINVARDGWRRRAARDRLHEAHRPELLPTTTSAGDAAFVARRTLWAALDQLAPRRRAALVLYELEGVSIPDIARLLGVSAITIRWHLSRGRHELAAWLEGKRTS